MFSSQLEQPNETQTHEQNDRMDGIHLGIWFSLDKWTLPFGHSLFCRFFVGLSIVLPAYLCDRTESNEVVWLRQVKTVKETDIWQTKSVFVDLILLQPSNYADWVMRYVNV